MTYTPEPGSIHAGLTECSTTQDMIDALWKEYAEFDIIAARKFDNEDLSDVDAVETLIERINAHAPAGHWFGGHPEAPWELGYWPTEF
jgi:hypothetical protein